MEFKNITKKIGFYDGFKNFHIPSARQDKVYDQIKENAKGDFDFFLLTFASSVIITLGLIIDSGAVVIGGMLIAPVVWPIFLTSLAILMGRGKILEKALFTLVKAGIVIFLVPLVIGFFIPDIFVGGQEILARTNPTIFELVIALTSGFVGAFIVSYPKLGSAMAGVVVAAAVVPPIAVTGLAVSQNDLQAAGGSLLLFLSNLVAIIFASGALFLLARFRGPSTSEGKEVRRVNIRWFSVLFVAVLIPLILVTASSLEQETREKMVSSVIKSEVADAAITEMNITEENGIVVAEITLRSGEGVSKWQVTKMSDVLSRALEQSVFLKITVVPVVEAGYIITNSNTLEVGGQESTKTKY